MRGNVRADDLEWQLRACFAAVFPEVSPEDLGGASVEALDEWDSIATVTLLSVIEDEFAVEFSDAGIERAVSFDSVLAYLRELSAQD